MSVVAPAGSVPRAGQPGSQRVVEVSGAPVPAGALSLEEAVRPFGVTSSGITFIDGQQRQTLSYDELAARAAATADNELDSVLLVMGIWSAGAAFVSVPRPSKRDTGQFAGRFGALLAACGCGFVVDEPGSKLAALTEAADGPRLIPAAALRGLPGSHRDEPAAIGDLALIQFTSGSVSAPKGVAISPRALARHTHMIGRESGVVAEDRLVSWLPLSHDMGLIAMFLNALYHRADLVLMSPSAFAFGPSRWLSTLAAERGTYTAAPDFAYRMAALVPYDAGLDLSCVRRALCGGERVSWRTMQDFLRAAGPLGFRPEALAPVYGLAENVAAVSAEHDSVIRGPGGYVSAGTPIGGVSIRAPEDLPAGPVRIRSEYLFQGYYTADGFRPATADGWYDTGDDGFIADGRLYVVGRRAEVASIAGRNVFAEDIESAVRDAADLGIRTCAAFRMPGPVQQFGLMAEVTAPAGGPGEIAELGARTRAAVTDAIGVRLATVLLVRTATIPRTPSGKVQRAHCRTLHADGQLGRRLLCATDQ